MDSLNDLAKRVSFIETYLKINYIAPSSSIPITIVVEGEMYTENVNENSVILNPLYKLIEKNDYHVFVRIYFHGQNIKSRTHSSSGHGYYENIYIRPNYTVLVIQHIPSYHEDFHPQLNTTGTKNTHHYLNLDRTASLYFGYSNTNSPLEPNNLFVHGRSKGIFFILNDKVYNSVSKYIGEHSTDIEVVRKGLAKGNLDIYKCKHLETTIEVRVISEPKGQENNSPAPTQARPTTDEDAEYHSQL